MKTKMFLTVLAVAGLSGVSGSALAQNTSTAPAPLVISGTTVSSAPAAPAAQPLGYGVSEVLRLSRAQLGDDTIIAYIRNSGLGFAMNADMIIYLRQQGVSTPVLNAMLSQPASTVASSAYVPVPTTAAPAVDDSDANYTPYYTPYSDYYTDDGYYDGYYYPGPYVVGGGWYGGGYYWGRGGHGTWHGGTGWHSGGSGGWGGSGHASSAAVVHSSGGGGFRGGGGGFHGGGFSGGGGHGGGRR